MPVGWLRGGMVLLSKDPLNIVVLFGGLALRVAQQFNNPRHKNNQDLISPPKEAVADLWWCGMHDIEASILQYVASCVGAVSIEEVGLAMGRRAWFFLFVFFFPSPF